MLDSTRVAGCWLVADRWGGCRAGQGVDAAAEPQHDGRRRCQHHVEPEQHDARPLLRGVGRLRCGLHLRA